MNRGEPIFLPFPHFLQKSNDKNMEPRGTEGGPGPVALLQQYDTLPPPTTTRRKGE